MEQILIDCCVKFLEIIKSLRKLGKITQDEYEDMAKLKLEFLLGRGVSEETLRPQEK